MAAVGQKITYVDREGQSFPAIVEAVYDYGGMPARDNPETTDQFQRVNLAYHHANWSTDPQSVEYEDCVSERNPLFQPDRPQDENNWPSIVTRTKRRETIEAASGRVIRVHAVPHADFAPRGEAHWTEAI